MASSLVQFGAQVAKELYATHFVNGRHEISSMPSRYNGDLALSRPSAASSQAKEFSEPGALTSD